MSSKALSFDSAAFDAFAADYDATFTDSTLGRLLRPRVWEVLAQHFQPGDHILELACGTGEDAVWLAQRGLHVTATDGSVQMVAQTQAKAQAAGVKEQVNAVQMSLQQLVRGQGAGGRGQGSGVTKQGAGSRGVFDFAQGTPSSPPALQSSTPPIFHPSLPPPLPSLLRPLLQLRRAEYHQRLARSGPESGSPDQTGRQGHLGADGAALPVGDRLASAARTGQHRVPALGRECPGQNRRGRDPDLVPLRAPA